MGKDKSPVTAAVRQLRAERVDFEDHPYSYEEKGGYRGLRPRTGRG